MYPHNDRPTLDGTLHNFQTEHMYAAYPAVVSSPQFSSPSQSMDGSYYTPFQHSYADAYPQPCQQEYSTYPFPLRIQTDVHDQYTDAHPQSPYASASVSTSTYPPTPPSVDSQSAISEHHEYDYESKQLTFRSTHHSDAPIQPVWQQQSVPDNTQQPYSHPESEHQGPNIPSNTQWTLPYEDDPTQQFPPSYYHTAQDREHHASSYPEQEVYPHAAHYGEPAVREGAYGHEAFQSQVEYEPSNHPENLDQQHSEAHVASEQIVYSPREQAPPAFNSPLCEHPRELADDAEYEYTVPATVPVPEHGISYVQPIDTNFQEQHPSGTYLEAGPSSWHPSPPSELPQTYSQPPALQSSPSHSAGELQSPPAISPPSWSQVPCEAPASHSAPAQIAPVMVPLREERLSAAHSPPGETLRTPRQPPPLLEPEPIPRLSQPHRRSAAAHADAESSTQPLSSSARPAERSCSRNTEQEEPLPQAPIVPSQSHLVSRRDKLGPPKAPPQQTPPFRPFHPYPSHQRNELSPRLHYHDGTAGGCLPPMPVFGLFGSYPLSRGPREQPLPGPTCAPASSSSVMRLVLTPPFKRPPPPPPPIAPPVPVRRPRMACYFCRKRKIACGPGPPSPPRDNQGGKDTTHSDDDGPCNQCARRGLECERPTESKRGVRKGKGRVKEGEGDQDEQAHPEASGSDVGLELALQPPGGDPTCPNGDNDPDDKRTLEDEGNPPSAPEPPKHE